MKRWRACLAVLWLVAGQAVAHGDEDHSHDPQPPGSAMHSVGDAGNPQRLADGSLFIPKPMQRQLGLRTQLARIDKLAVTRTFNGTVVADPNASGRVQAVESGRVEAGPMGLPNLGQSVRKGQVLAWLKPVTSSLERGNRQALLAELKAQSAVAERRVRRLDQLEGAVPQKDIDAARFERDALQQRRAAIAGSLATAEPLRAAVSGVISRANVVVGQVVEAREVLFEVIDPARLVVEALSYDTGPAEELGEAVGQYPGGSVPLQFIGAGLQLREQAMPLLFRVKSSRSQLAIGLPVKVIAKTASQTEGIAIPQTALVRNAAGDSVVWLHTAAERYAPRSVKWRPLSADSVDVTAGLGNGDRIVIEGAGLLARMR